MTPRDRNICANIGKLLAAFTASLNKVAKIGQIFPPHYYAYFVYLLFYANDDETSQNFQQMSVESKFKLCVSLAELDPYGIKDPEGNAFFKNKAHVIPQNPTEASSQSLSQLWILLNSISDRETLEGLFPKMAEHQWIFDDPTNMIIENKDIELFSELFSNELFNVDNPEHDKKQQIHSIIQHYVIDAYSRQCEALSCVIYGFKKSMTSSTLLSMLQTYLRDNPTETGQAFSEAIQGPPFTRQAFQSLINRSVIHRSVPRAKRLLMRKRIKAIKESYLNQPPTQEAEALMKAMVECATGSYVIQADTKLIFYSPRKRLNRHEPKTIFHSCSGVVELGNELMVHKITTAVDRQKLFEKWLDHVTEALATGFSLE